MVASRAFGDRWLQENRTAILRVPSVITNGRESRSSSTHCIWSSRSCEMMIPNQFIGTRGSSAESLRPKYRFPLVLRVDNMNASVSGRESLNGAAEPGRDLLEIDVFDGAKSV
jgi:hypothetical protein